MLSGDVTALIQELSQELLWLKEMAEVQISSQAALLWNVPGFQRKCENLIAVFPMNCIYHKFIRLNSFLTLPTFSFKLLWLSGKVCGRIKHKACFPTV